MSDSAKAVAALALHRFGMGPRPGSIAAIEADPRGALIAELDRPSAAEVAAAALPSSSKAFRTVADANAKRQAKAIVAAREQKEAKKQQMAAAPAMMEGSEQGAGAMAAKIAAEAVPDPGRPIYLEEARVRIEAALGAEIGFVERLVWFWSNHFCISADKIQSMSGAYEREAIRPHVLGRFADMLLAVEGHPAMLFYLDNPGSMGPNSVAGINRTRGLNENLARETLELHTLGVRSGYTQDDVISFANVLTGWSLLPPGDNPEHGGEFSFNPRLHEPGAQKVLGKLYEDEGVEQGRAVLRDLAAHPATATHVATRLASYFIADTPPAPLVERMAKVFLDSSGDLKEIAKAMVSSDEVLDPAARQTQAAERVGRRHGARHRPHAGRSCAIHGWAGASRRTLVASFFAQGFSGRRGILDRRHGAAAGRRQLLRGAHRGQGRSPGCDRDRLRIVGIGRGEAGGGPRREPPAGARAVVHVGRMPEEVNMGFRHHLPSRREALLGAGALFAWSQMPRLARAEGRDPRMLVIVLRGALDGLGAVAPVGDPDWIGLRGDRALVLDGKTPALPLDGFFALNPAMPNLHRLYAAQQATIVHATATPYRERSHFDGQDVLESGIAKPGAADTGWLNRALVGLASDGQVDPRGSRVLGVGSVTPLVVRGKAPVMTWVPQQLLPASDDTQARLLDLYQHTDPRLAAALEARIRLAALGSGAGLEGSKPDGASLPPPGIARVRAYFAEAAGAAARLLAKPDGPRVGAVGFVGWDTHINEGAASGQLANLLGALDGALAAIETNMGEAWRETVVAVVTEFGRTARINGTDGTDHGTGTVAFLAGGALRGGRVVADWPGLKTAQLYEARDLKPTTDLRAVLKGLLRDHLRVEERVLASTVFPDSADVAPTAGLVG